MIHLKSLQSVMLKNLSFKTKQQIVLFLFVGALNTLFSYLCYALFIYLGFHYTLAVWIATCLGVLFNFNTTGRIVFKNSQDMLIFKFIGVYLFLYCLNISFLKIMQVWSTNYYLTGFIAVFPLAAISFVLNKYLVFKEHYEVN